jgi:Sap-like sulfolipid-1-addressing protein
VSLRILPLALTMMAGPQIMSAFVFVTAKRPVRVSLGFLVGVALAATLGVTIMRGLASLLGSAVSLGDSSDRGAAGTIIQVVLVALLAAAAVKAWLGRETAEPPKWLGTLLAASPRRAFEVGFLLILLMPSDLVVMLTVGVNLEQNDSSILAAAPFLGLTVLVAALPLLGFLLFHHWAQRALPQVRDWMNGHSWLVNILVCLVFIALILAG